MLSSGAITLSSHASEPARQDYTADLIRGYEQSYLEVVAEIRKAPPPTVMTPNMKIKVLTNVALKRSVPFRRLIWTLQVVASRS